MTELLSREKEFLKLNEQLNQKTKMVLENNNAHIGGTDMKKVVTKQSPRRPHIEGNRNLMGRGEQQQRRQNKMVDKGDKVNIGEKSMADADFAKLDILCSTAPTTPRTRNKFISSTGQKDSQFASQSYPCTSRFRSNALASSNRSYSERNSPKHKTAANSPRPKYFNSDRDQAGSNIIGSTAPDPKRSPKYEGFTSVDGRKRLLTVPMDVVTMSKINETKRLADVNRENPMNNKMRKPPFCSSITNTEGSNVNNNNNNNTTRAGGPPSMPNKLNTYPRSNHYSNISNKGGNNDKQKQQPPLPYPFQRRQQQQYQEGLNNRRKEYKSEAYTAENASSTYSESSAKQPDYNNWVLTKTFNREERLPANNALSSKTATKSLNTTVSKDESVSTARRIFGPPPTFNRTPIRKKLPLKEAKQLFDSITETFRNEKFRETLSLESIVSETNSNDQQENNSEITTPSVEDDRISLFGTSPQSPPTVTTTATAVTAVTAATATIVAKNKEIASDKDDHPNSNRQNQSKATSRSSRIDIKKFDKHDENRKNNSNMSRNGLVKYLKSKIVILQEELDTTVKELSKRIEELQKSYEIQKRLETQRDQVIAKNNQLTEQISKLENKLISSERKLKDRELEYGNSQRELDTVKRELRILSQTNTNLEKRLYRSNEELENAKNSLNSHRDSEREIKEANRQEKEIQNKQIKQLKKQRLDLLNAYKKQLFLIDNLRRQNICLEQSKMIGFGEKEFTKVLEWNTKN